MALHCLFPKIAEYLSLTSVCLVLNILPASYNPCVRKGIFNHDSELIWNIYIFCWPNIYIYLSVLLWLTISCMAAYVLFLSLFPSCFSLWCTPPLTAAYVIVLCWWLDFNHSFWGNHNLIAMTITKPVTICICIYTSPHNAKYSYHEKLYLWLIYHFTTCYSPLAFSQKIWAWLQFGFFIWNLHDDYCVNFVVFMTAQIPNLVQITVFLHIVGPISTYPVTVIASRSPIMEVLVTPEQVVVLIQIPKAQSQMVHFLEKIQ